VGLTGGEPWLNSGQPWFSHMIVGSASVRYQFGISLVFVGSSFPLHPNHLQSQELRCESRPKPTSKAIAFGSVELSFDVL